MSNTSDFTTKLEEIKLIDSKEVQKPDMPVDTYLQEAENREKLLKHR